MVSMCNETNMAQLLRLLQQWVNIWIMAGASMQWKGVPRKCTFYHGRRSIHQSNLLQQVSESLFMHFVYLLKKVKLRVWHNPSVKVIDIWTGSYWIAYFLWGYNLCSCGCCVWLAVEPNWEHTHHLDTLSRWQQINSLIAHRWQIQFKQFITCWGMVLQLFVRVFEKISERLEEKELTQKNCYKFIQ